MHKTECIIILQALVMTPVVYMWRSLDDYEGHYKSTYEELDNDQIIINWNCLDIQRYDLFNNTCCVLY